MIWGFAQSFFETPPSGTTKVGWVHNHPGSSTLRPSNADGSLLYLPGINYGYVSGTGPSAIIYNKEGRKNFFEALIDCLFFGHL